MPAFVSLLEEIKLRFPKIQLTTLNIFRVIITPSKDLSQTDETVRRQEMLQLNQNKGEILQALIYLAMTQEEAPEQALEWYDIKDGNLGQGMRITISNRNGTPILEAPPAYSLGSLARYLTSRFVATNSAVSKFREEWIERFGPHAMITAKIPAPMPENESRSKLEPAEPEKTGSIVAIA